jgi:hypothetical protein
MDLASDLLLTNSSSRGKVWVTNLFAVEGDLFQVASATDVM